MMTMPGKGSGIEEFEVRLFRVGVEVTSRYLEHEFARWNLFPLDPYALAAINEADWKFADTFPNATHWLDPDGKRCFVTFGTKEGNRYLRVGRDSGYMWNAQWWFAGRPTLIDDLPIPFDLEWPAALD